MNNEYTDPVFLPRNLYDEIRHRANLERIPLNKMAARIVREWFMENPTPIKIPDAPSPRQFTPTTLGEVEPVSEWTPPFFNGR